MAKLLSAFSEGLVNQWSGLVSDSTVALSSGESEVVTYGELADLLRSTSSQPTITAIVFSPSVAGISSYLKSISEPGPTILLDHRISKESLADILARFKVTRLEGPTETISSLGLEQVKVIDHWAVAKTKFDGDGLTDLTSTLLLGTSGSTGNKKFVRLSSKSVFANASDIGTGLSLTSDDVAATILPPSYSYGLSVINSVLLAGGRIFAEDLNPLQRDFRNLLERERVTHLPGVPSLYEMYERLGIIGDPPRYLRAFTQAGGKLAPDKVRDFSLSLESKAIQFFPMYGQTEATARMSILDSSLAAEYPESVGSPVRSGRFTIGTAENKDEIVFEGPNVMLGYIEQARGNFDDDDLGGVLATGDLGVLKDGLLYIHGRSKRIVKISGTRIDMDELENLIEPLGRCAVVSDGNRLSVMVVNQDPSAVEKVGELLSEMGFSRTNYQVFPIETIRYTDSGKKDYPAMSVAAGI